MGDAELPSEVVPHYLDNLQAYLEALREEVKKLAELTDTPIHLMVTPEEEYYHWQQRYYEGHWF